VTSDSGDSQRTYSYEPFGTATTELQQDPGAPPNPIRFAGEYLDATSLTHLRARQYDTKIGRFLSLDPVAPQIADPYLSSYVYAQDQPTVFVDPSGRCIVCVGALVGGALGAVTYGATTAIGGGFTWRGLAAATAGGAVAGATGTYLSPVIARHLGGTLLPRLASNALAGGVGGVAGVSVEQAICGSLPSPSATLIGGGSGAAGTALGEGAFPPRGGFPIRSIPGLIRIQQVNTRRLWLSGGLGGLAGVGIGYVAGTGATCK
jgi:RHS repeat-associated protein